MLSDLLLFSLFLIFGTAAFLSTLALHTRQSLLVAYLFVGILLGPWGLELLNDTTLITELGDVGIVFLLFLLGLHLHPQNLWHMLRNVTLLTVVSSVIFLILGGVLAYLFGFTWIESLLIGTAIMFSSTIIGLKLLPTTILHHQHTGEVMISILLMQDLLAIIVLLFLNAATGGGIDWQDLGLMSVALPAVIGVAFIVERYVLVKLIAHFERIREYIFLVVIAWCLSLAILAKVLGLSEEIGAFIAGVTLAASPIANFIAECLKPLRDFFLVLFFFSLGANLNLDVLPSILLPAALLAVICLLLKPVVYRYLLHKIGETPPVAAEVGVRLAQASEFSLLVGYLASDVNLIGQQVNYLIQTVTILTFIVSSYWVVLRYPTPLALTASLQRD